MSSSFIRRPMSISQVDNNLNTIAIKKQDIQNLCFTNLEIETKNLDNISVILENKEKELLTKIGKPYANKDPKEASELLTKKLKKIYQEKVANLSGLDLRKTFIDPTKNSEAIAYREKLQDRLDTLIVAANQNIKSEIFKSIFKGLNTKYNSSEELKKAYLSIINNEFKTIKNRSNHYSSTKGIIIDKITLPNTENVGNEKYKISRILLRDLTINQFQAWVKILENQKVIKELEKINKENINLKEAVKTFQKGDNLQILVDWKEITKGMTQNQAKSSNNKNLLNDVNQRLILAIQQACPNANQNYLKIAIEKVIGKYENNWKIETDDSTNFKTNPYEFFIGENYDKITGLLGEIQGLYYLLELKEGNQDGIVWSGGNFLNGEQPHTDIILHQFGVQIKNTSTDLLKKDMIIDFKEWSYDDFKKYFPSIIDYEMDDTIDSILDMSGFNIEYITDNGEITRGSSPEFSNRRQQIEEYQQSINQLFIMALPSSMYMAIENKIDNSEPINSNLLYIAGAYRVSLASKILEDEINKIKAKEVSSFTFEGAYKYYDSKKKQTHSYTIIDAIKEGKKRGIDSLNRKVKSSYNFKN